MMQNEMRNLDEFNMRFHFFRMIGKDLQTKVVIGAFVAAAGIAASLAYLIIRNRHEPIPTK